MTDQGRQRRERSCGSWSSQMQKRRAASRTQVDPERVLNESRPCLDWNHHQYIAIGGSLSPGEDNYSSYRRQRGCARPRECDAIETPVRYGLGVRCPVGNLDRSADSARCHCPGSGLTGWQRIHRDGTAENERPALRYSGHYLFTASCLSCGSIAVTSASTGIDEQDGNTFPWKGFVQWPKFL